MSLLQIRGAFQSRLSTWATDRTPALLIAWQNVSFPPRNADGTVQPMPALYLRAFLMPAETDSLDLAGEHRAYTGIFQVNILSETNKGTLLVEGIAAELEALFPLNLRMSTPSGPVLIYTPMSQGPALQDGGTFTLPVWCRYRMDTI